MNKYLALDKGSDALIETAMKYYGRTSGELTNMAIKDAFLPVTEPFNTEGRFLLQQHVAGKLDDWTIKQSMSRGIRALGTRPVRDPAHLRWFFARYCLHEIPEKCSIDSADSLWKSATEIYAILDKQQPMGGTKKIDGAYLLDDIFDAWDALWNQKATYDVLATIAFRFEPSQPFSWFDAIAFLTNVEHEALRQWG